MSLTADTWLCFSNKSERVKDLLVEWPSEILGIDLVVSVSFSAAIVDGLDETVIEKVIRPVMAHHRPATEARTRAPPDQQIPHEQKLLNLVLGGFFSEKTLI